MTADERIEGMLNQLGQTMATLPSPVFENVEGRDANVLMAYEYPDRYNAVRVALKWHILNASIPEEQSEGTLFATLSDYICHLVDVIDKLEIALDTALNALNVGEMTGQPVSVEDIPLQDVKSYEEEKELIGDAAEPFDEPEF